MDSPKEDPQPQYASPSPRGERRRRSPSPDEQARRREWGRKYGRLVSQLTAQWREEGK